MRFYPNSNHEDHAPQPPLREFNACHNPAGAKGGQFCATPGSGTAAKSYVPTDQLAQPASQVAAVKPVRVTTIEEALDLIHRGQVVELQDVKTLHVLLRKMAEITAEAKAKGEKAPNYDLCKVTVKGSNLFCEDRIRSAKYPKGIDRIEMPQLSAEPMPGTPADQLPRKGPGKNTVDASLAFVDHLEASGIRVGGVMAVPVGSLKATQAELVGADVARMMTDTAYNPGKQPIFISRDNYILDGHHRWAAIIGRDAEDGTLDERSTINVIRIDAPMSALLFAAMDWTTKFGLQPRSGKARVFESAQRELALDHLWMLN